MSKFALFLGCQIPFRVPLMEVAARKVLERFDIELETMPLACCPDPIGVRSISTDTWHTLAARNLCVAETMGLDIMTMCNGCFETLKTVNEKLKHDTTLKDQVNTRLADVGREWKGTLSVKHGTQVLIEDVGLDRIRQEVQEPSPVSHLKVAAHSGCHFTKPSNILQTDDPDRPQLLTQLIETTGAQSVTYRGGALCCGTGILNIASEQASQIARTKLHRIQAVKADAMITSCPFCFLSYDSGQLLINRTFGDSLKIPILDSFELVALAIGIHPNELGFKLHRVKTRDLIRAPAPL